MKHLKTTWSPLLLGMLLMAVLVGVAGDGTPARAAVGSRQLIIPAGDFHPDSNLDTVRFTNRGYYMYSDTTVTLTLYAAVQFPVAYYATVDKLELMACDNNPSGTIAVGLYKTKPAAGNEIGMAYIDTGEASTDPTDPRIWVDTSIDNPTVKPAEGTYLMLYFDTAGIPTPKFYGVRIWYHPGF